MPTLLCELTAEVTAVPVRTAGALLREQRSEKQARRANLWGLWLGVPWVALSLAAVEGVLIRAERAQSFACSYSTQGHEPTATAFNLSRHEGARHRLHRLACVVARSLVAVHFHRYSRTQKSPSSLVCVPFPNTVPVVPQCGSLVREFSIES